MELELDGVRVFDVLRNGLNGELLLVMAVSGGLLDLRDGAGTITRFKFGPHFSRAGDEEASAFRTALLALRRRQRQESGRKASVRSATSVLKRLSSKRR